MTLIAAGRLGNNANNLTPPSNRREKRALRYARRRLLNGLTTLPRCRKCGRTRRDSRVGVKAAKGPSDRSGFSGLVTCGSVWACTVCNSKIMATRGTEISAGIATWMGLHSGSILLLTLTLQHDQGDRLGPQWDILLKAWTKTASGKVWKKWRERLGAAGYIRATEVTDGANGWHSHLHVLLFVENQDGYDDIDEFREWLCAKWARSVRSLGGDAKESVQDVRTIKGASDPAIAGYLTKSQDSLGFELTHSQGKSERGRLGTKPYWYLFDKIEEGDADALARWHEFEAGSKGRRQMSWSRGLRDLLGLRKEKTDEEIAEEVAGDSTLVYIPGEAWDDLSAHRAWLAPQILDAAEEGIKALCRFLDNHSIPYETEEA